MKDLKFSYIGNETIDGWLDKANERIEIAIQEAKKEVFDDVEDMLYNIPAEAVNQFQLSFPFDFKKIRQNHLSTFSTKNEFNNNFTAHSDSPKVFCPQCNSNDVKLVNVDYQCNDCKADFVERNKKPS